MSSSKGLVLVSGANSFVGGAAIEALLKAGYSVRGTVRSKASGDPLIEALPEYADKIEIVQVADITAAGAFDEAVQGVDAVAHIAAPVALNFDDPEPVMTAAIEGIKRILESAHATPSVKSFVFMSSVVAILSPKEGDEIVYTEADWNTASLDTLAEQGKNTPGHIIYYASKTAAEQALWAFRDKQHPKFSVTALNPCFVTGPPVVVPKSPSGINFTSRTIWDVLAGVPLAEAGLAGLFHGFVDVRDVGRMVAFSVAHPEKTDGERFLLASHYGPAQSIADILRRQYPERAAIIHEGTPGEGYFLPGYIYPKGFRQDGTKATRVSGQDYIPWEKTVVDMAEKLKPLLTN
ncbi:hypothetical protein B0T26DRAFT_742245 [Lasiosphaeria miniovina]|uniref:NAD-dependent epimerase/dehydratase domain-containing protein n=1 Tax=Lasiosphaeria miniovina TaxID=1954250 RepID=A0AA40DVY2_9PEZI|nr:uncharacterized protein B0T26DRAFT_742245 [Lasiosphaeria miniovina]KAK0713688.1 hypothetical protein B0T26DRAFT_742245 [Lasiosphaeria miniovina]